METERISFEAYRQSKRRRLGLLGALGGAVVLLFFASLSVGAAGADPVSAVRGLFGFGDLSLVVRNIRLPRALAALVAGAGLAMAGCVMQNTLGNEMASPATLGVSNAAVLGANAAIVLFGAGSVTSGQDGVRVQSPFLVTALAFLFALGAVALVLLLTVKRGCAPGVVVLSGVAIGALCTAITTVLQVFAADGQVTAAVFWTFGDLGRASLGEDAVMAVVVLLAGGYFAFRAGDHNALAAGEETARSLGVRVSRVRLASLLLAALVCAVTVSFLGIIGFVGLLAPAVLRRRMGDDSRFLLPASALCGAVLLLFADTVTRLLPLAVSLPVGAVTSLCGAPVFLFLILKNGREAA